MKTTTPPPAASSAEEKILEDCNFLCTDDEQENFAYPCHINKFQKECILELLRFYRQEVEREVVERIQCWAYEGGITHKKSFVKLIKFLDSLYPKSNEKN